MKNMTLKDYMLLEKDDMRIQDAIDQLKKEGKELTPQNVADVLDIDVSTVKRAAKPLSTVFPEIRKTFNVGH